MAAAPGSGKTSLLSEWHADPRESRPFAWLSLDRADNDPVRFWDGVFAALRTTAPQIGDSAHEALNSPGTTVADQVLPLLVNDLAALAEPVVLVLDDYHLIDNGEISGAIEAVGRAFAVDRSSRDLDAIRSAAAAEQIARPRSPHRGPWRRPAIRRHRSARIPERCRRTGPRSRRDRAPPRADGGVGGRASARWPVVAGPAGSPGVHRLLRRGRSADRRLPRIRGPRPRVSGNCGSS